MCLSSSVRRESIAETCRRGRQSASRERITSFPPSFPPLRFPLSSLSRRAARTTPASPSTTLLQTIHLNPIANAPVLHPLHHPHYHFHPIRLPIQSSHPASRPLLSTRAPQSPPPTTHPHHPYTHPHPLQTSTSPSRPISSFHPQLLPLCAR